MYLPFLPLLLPTARSADREARETPHVPARVVFHPPRVMKASIRRLRLGRCPVIQGIVVVIDRPHPAATAADHGARGTLEVQPCCSPDHLEQVRGTVCACAGCHHDPPSQEQSSTAETCTHKAS